MALVDSCRAKAEKLHGVALNNMLEGNFSCKMSSSFREEFSFLLRLPAPYLSRRRWLIQDPDAGFLENKLDG